jgi:hypothetical protein
MVAKADCNSDPGERLRSELFKCAVFDEAEPGLERKRRNSLVMNARYGAQISAKPRIAGFQA